MFFFLLFFSAEYKNALREVESILNSALDEIDNYCDMNNWLVDIFKFCLKWTSDSPKEYRGAPAFTIEVSLSLFNVIEENLRAEIYLFVLKNIILSREVPFIIIIIHMHVHETCSSCYTINLNSFVVFLIINSKD